LLLDKIHIFNTLKHENEGELEVRKIRRKVGGREKSWERCETLHFGRREVVTLRDRRLRLLVLPIRVA
jgi:hypothetical protein